MVPDPPESIYDAAAYEVADDPGGLLLPTTGRSLPPWFRNVVTFVYRAAYADGRQAAAVDQARATAGAIEDACALYIQQARDTMGIGAAAPLPAPIAYCADGMRRAAEIAARGGR